MGYYYLRARYYDPAIGRFISKDPFKGISTNPATLHCYVYVGNNPTNLMDPSGQFPPDIVDVALWVRDRILDAQAGWLHMNKNSQSHFNGGWLNQTLAGTIAAFSSYDRKQIGDVVLYQNCGGLAGWVSENILLGPKAFVIGSFIFTTAPALNPEVLQHELVHVSQYDRLRATFLPRYMEMQAIGLLKCRFDLGCATAKNPLEQEADRQAGTDFYGR